MNPIRILSLLWVAGTVAAAPVEQLALPEGGIQPRALSAPDGTLHLVWFSGSDKGGDIWHATRRPGASVGAPVRVNSEPGSAVAIGTIRGAQAALGKDGRVHVVWNGAWKQKGDRPPLHYTRLGTDGTSFEPQRALSGDWVMDGGGAVAADSRGNVHVFYHGGKGDGGGEAARRVLVRSSSDDGRTFAAERILSPEDSGVCGCCAMQALATDDGTVIALYRTASDGGRQRDMAALTSRDGGRTFSQAIVDRWKVAACPMSSMSLAASKAGIVGAWEREGQIFVAAARGGAFSRPVSPEGEPNQRKHPVLAAQGDRVLLAWTEGTGWQKGGSMAWQILEGSTLGPTPEQGRAGGVKVWSFVSAAATADGFVIVR